MESKEKETNRTKMGNTNLPTATDLSEEELTRKGLDAPSLHFLTVQLAGLALHGHDEPRTNPANSFTAVNAETSQLCANPDHLANLLSGMDLIPNPPPMLPADTHPPFLIDTFESMPAETFQYIEYQLIQMWQTQHDVQQVMADAGVFVATAALDEITEKLVYLLQLVKARDEDPALQTDEFDIEILAAAHRVTAHYDTNVPAITN